MPLQAPTVKRNISDIKALLLKAKDKQAQTAVTTIKDSIADLRAEIKQIPEQEEVALDEVEVLRQQLQEDAATLAEAKQNQDALLAIGENPGTLIADVETMVADVKAKIQEMQDKLTSLQADKLQKQKKLSDLVDELRRVENHSYVETTATINSPTTIHQQEQERERLERNKEREDLLLACCRDEIKRAFNDSYKMEVKLQAYLNDKVCRTYLIDILGGEIRSFQAEPEFFNLNENEIEALRKSLGRLKAIIRKYDTFYIQSLSPTLTHPRDFRTWSEYTADVRKQMLRYLDGQKNGFTQVSEPPKFGVVRPAPPAPPAVHVPVITQVITIIPAKPTVIIPTSCPKPSVQIRPIVKKVSYEKKVQELIAQSGVLRKTTGMRVGVIAGASGKNEMLRDFLERAFCFKRLTWHDGRNNDDLIASIKVKGLDLLVAVPAWHMGYKRYVDIAKSSGISTLVLVSHNKFKICEFICQHFGISIDFSKADKKE